MEAQSKVQQPNDTVLSQRSQLPVCSPDSPKIPTNLRRAEAADFPY